MNIPELKVERFDDKKHYDALSSWCLDYKLAKPNLDMLPKFGIVIAKESEPLSMMFMCSSDCKAVWMDLLIGNPKADKSLRSSALDLALSEICKEAKHMGYTTILGATARPELIKRLIKNNMNLCEDKASLFMKVL